MQGGNIETLASGRGADRGALRDARRTLNGIILGKGGQTMRRIGTAARKELQVALDRRIHLFAHVKYRKDWMNDAARYSIWDLDYHA